MRLTISLICSIIIAFNSFAVDFYDNGFAFSIISETEKLCSIEANEQQPYSGAIVIPSYVDYEGVSYQVYQINSYAFADCSGITSLTIPSTLMSVKNDAFSGKEYSYSCCSSLERLIIEDSDSPLSLGYRSIGGSGASRALFYGSPIKYIYLGRNLQTYINGNSGYYGPFSGLPLHEVYISDFVTELPNYIFSYCDDYTEDNIPQKSIQSIRFSPYLTKIPSSAFNQSLNMSILEIPENVEIIASNAFYGNSSLKEVHLGSKINKLETYAFSACSNLSVVYCHTITPPNASGAAYSYDIANARLRVPSESVEAYKKDPWWKNFGEILPLSVNDPLPITPLRYTILFPESGAISQNVKDGQVLSFQISPNEGWLLHSLTENGVEVSDKVDENGMFTTEPIHQNTELSAVFKNGTNSAISTINEDPQIRVSLEGSTLHIQGDYNLARLYKIDGTLVSEIIYPQYCVESQGVYILKVDNSVFKFAIGQ